MTHLETTSIQVALPVKTEVHHGFRSDSLVSSTVELIPFHCDRAGPQQVKTKLDRSNTAWNQPRLNNCTRTETALRAEHLRHHQPQHPSCVGREAQEEQTGKGIPSKAFGDAKVWEGAHMKAMRLSSLGIIE